MANVKITGLTAYTDPVSTDVLPIVDVSNDATKKVSIADLLENAGTGSAAAPSFSFDGDNNTGIYRPGEDQIAISTNGTQRLSINSAGLASFANNVTIEGDLTVNGATTTIDSTTLIVEDKNIEMGSVTTPTDSTADGGGITLKGATDKTINWINSTDAWTLSEHVNIASAKEFRIAGTKVLDATSLGSAVVSSSLTSVGTIGTGVWNGTAIASAYIADSAITSAKIADGAIVNADVNASAAIAGSKITTGTTSAVGVLQLTDSTSSTSTTTAATPNSVKTAYDLANAALPKAGGTLTGDLTIPDKIIHSGDTNTFIRFPAADTFSVDTAGSERLRIDSSGNVLIGGTLPSSPNIELNANGLAEFASSVNVGPFVNGSTRGFRLGVGSVGATLIIQAEAGISSANSFMQCKTGADEKFVLKTNGSAEFAGNLTIADKIIHNGDTNTAVRFPANDTVSVETAGSERLRIDSSGRLLVGTSSARSNLFTSVSPQSQVEGTDVSTSSLGLTCNNTNAGGTPILAFGKSAGSSVGSNTLVSNNHKLGQIDFLGNNGSNFISGARINAEVDGTPGSNDMPGRIVLATTADGASSPTERMRIDSSGKVGIGLTPTAPLHVGGTIQSQTGSSVAQMYADGGSANFASVGAYPALFHVNGSERMRIDSSGRLLVGTSTSTQNVSMIAQGSSAGSSQRAQAILALGASNPADGATLGILSYSDSGHAPAAWVFAARDGGTWTSGTSQPTRLVFATTADGASSPTERMRINSSGEINCPGVYTDTTALAANVRVGVAGGLQRSTSSIKYKTSVETLENSYADALLSCRPVWYKSKCASDDPTWGHWGFIAEEVAEIDPRLVHWKTSDVSYDENGSIVETASEPEPEGVQYDRFVPHLLNLIKRQQAAIETLEAKVTALESA